MADPDTELDPTRTALVVVDMQDYFCRSDSTFGRFVAALDPEGVAWYQERLTS